MAQLRNTTINDTGFIQLPSGNTSQRPANSSGQFRFNSETNKIENYNSDLNDWVGTPIPGIVAVGGDSVYDLDIEGTIYRVHVFTSTGNSTFNVSKGGEVEYLIVAGGGGGGSKSLGTSGGTAAGAGGGAGGMITGTTTVTPQSYTITVGAGGTGGGPTANGGTGGVNGTNGGNSVALGITATGGGYGRGNGNGQGGSGGSGGGSNGTGTTGGTGISGQGNDGGGAGHTTSGYPYPRAGGGGAGAKGGDANSSTGDGGKGGDGLVSFITGTSAWYAGGGGGAAYVGVGGQPGLGGGTKGGNPGEQNINNPDATPNTGGGGGGQGGGSVNNNGRASYGGSGIVVIRYPLNQENPITVGSRATNGLLIDYDFASPVGYSSGTEINDSRLGPYGGSISSTPAIIDSRTHRAHVDLNGNRINSPIRCSVLAGPNYTNPHAMEVWVKLTQYPQPLSSANQYGNTERAGFLIGAGSYGGIGLYWRGNSSGSACNVYAHIRNDASYRATDSYSLPLNTWTHLMHVNDGSGTFRLYVNGAEESTASTPNGLASRDASAGNIAVPKPGVDGGGTLSYINLPCQIGLARLYQGSLTAVDVANNYNSTRWRFGV